MSIQIVDGHVVGHVALRQTTDLLKRADQLRAKANTEDDRAKRALKNVGIQAFIVVTERGARLRRSAEQTIDEAMRIIDECPRQIEVDETWTG